METDLKEKLNIQLKCDTLTIKIDYIPDTWRWINKGLFQDTPLIFKVNWPLSVLPMSKWP